MKRRIILLWSIGIGIALFLIPFLQVEEAIPASPSDCPSCNSFGIQRFQEKKQAPAFSLKSLDGNQVALSDFRGKPVLLTFVATWCDACKEDCNLLEKFSAEKRNQLTILFIFVDGERKKKVQQIVNENKITFPVLLVLKEKIMDHYMVRGWIPQTFLVDREGMLVGKIVGQRDWSSSEAWSCLKELFSLR